MTKESESGAISSSEDRGRQSLQVHLRHQGPIPSPIILEGYEKILPGAAERCFKMAEEQAAHRKSEEKAENRRAFLIAVTGQVLGTIIILTVLFLAWQMVIRGQQLTALGTVLLALGSLVSVYFYGKSRNPSPPRVIELSKKEAQDLLQQLQEGQDNE